MDDAALYTIDELTELVGAALSVDYDGAPTGRVRDVPDQRAIRWYVTRGLVDRPVATRGRVALYGRRHLLQLVAIKRRQAGGRSLADIQAELAGATDRTLAAVARIEGDAARPVARPVPAPARARFWVDRPTSPVGVVAVSSAAVPTAAAVAGPEVFAESVALQGIRLAPGVTLLIENGTADPAAVYLAARPLLDLLAAGGPACEEER